MATTIAPDASTESSAPESLGDLSWLDTVNDVYQKNKEAWEREERRLHGGDAIIDELTQFDGESKDSFKARKNKASYVNFPKAHAGSVTGALSMHRPMPDKGLDFGGLGPIRSRDKIDTPSLAELLYYNVDGVGADGMEFPAWYDGVDERAQGTGHRWLMIESPDTDGTVTFERAKTGARPYAVEFSPLDVTNWYFRRGQLQFAVIRAVTTEPNVTSGHFDATSSLGYYLLVRQGYDGLGAAFAKGGWWLFDSDKLSLGSGRWTRTQGQIPMWIHYGEKSIGTKNRPAISRSSTMELGQIAVSLMDTISARDYDFWDACASRVFFLGADVNIMTAIADQVNRRSIYIGVPHIKDEKGELKPITPFDTSSGAVPAEVSSMIVEAKFAEAREQSFQQITSAPESSGESKKAGHAEQKAPALARRARYRQQSENTFIYFAELRFGVPSPKGFSIWPEDFDLTPLAEKIDLAFVTLRQSKLRSKTAETKMVTDALQERGVVNDENRGTVEAELGASFDQGEQRANAEASLFGGGAPS